MGLLNRTRPRVDLLQLMLDNIDLFTIEECKGLCQFIDELRGRLLISKLERKILFTYLGDNPPINLYTPLYYWKPWELKPRIEWIKHHIKLHQEE